MTASVGRPNLTVLETSRSIRRSLISSADDSPSGEKCSTPSELPVLSRSKTTAGDDHGFPWTSRISWFACVALLTLVVVMILGRSSVSLSAHCSDGPASGSSHVCSESVLPPGDHHSRNDFLRRKAIPTKRVHDSGRKEDEKCWSRTRHLGYRQSERRSPQSPHLSRALEEYTSLHARCTAGKDWKGLFKGRTPMVDGEDSCQYLIYVEGTEGLGNRLLSLVSAFTYALVTDRVLLLDTRRNISDLMCEPFQGSSWTLPASFPFEDVEGLPTLDSSVDEEMEKTGAVILNLRHEQSQRDQRFFCPDVQQLLGEVPWIAWKSNQYNVPRLFTMPAFWEKLSPLFDDPSRVFTQLSRFLLLPQNAIWARTERIYLSYLAASRKLVGLQVRTPQSRTFERPILDRMMECLVDDRILPKTIEPQQRQSQLNLARQEEGTSIFVASLQREYFEALKEVYADRDTEDGSPVTVHTMASESQENDSYDQSVNAMIDIWLLSFSDSLVTSGWSTFGYVAQGLGGVLPYIINTDLEQPSSCLMGQSVEPCNHFPFLSTCPAATHNVNAQYVKWTKKHLRTCQDEENGLQLVSS